MEEGNTKKFYVEYTSIASGIRLKKVLSSDDYILWINENSVMTLDNHFERDGTNIISLIIRIQDTDPYLAYHHSLEKLNKITAYLAGIFQVPFFLSNYDFFQVYDDATFTLNLDRRKRPLLMGGQSSVSGGIIFHRTNCKLVENLPSFDIYKKYEDVFYLWRSATDLYNELGWRFLGYIRIIEIITSLNRGGRTKAANMYRALSPEARGTITEDDFIKIILKWGNPTAHGNIPNAVIPKIPHGQFNQDVETLKLEAVVKILIKSHVKPNPN
ncbi:MAG: hypothetical protein G01um101431_906 [Parcubacteria group bacterium Gr01-1014_31]|nr:MAG: hypothetical protein G01um101431_906 [Parcubacteria group bacterium Gr01-1014_31]